MLKTKLLYDRRYNISDMCEMYLKIVQTEYYSYLLDIDDRNTFIVYKGKTFKKEDVSTHCLNNGFWDFCHKNYHRRDNIICSGKTSFNVYGDSFKITQDLLEWISKEVGIDFI